MIDYCDIASSWQVVLLVLSLLAAITLASCCILCIRHKCSMGKLSCTGAVLLFNIALYVPMQIGSRITAEEPVFLLRLPYGLLLLLTLLSLGFAVWMILHETKNRKTINNSSIKEAFDNLPTGMCFFNEVGLPVLCNRAMHRFSFEVCGRDVQFISDLQECLSDSFVPMKGTVHDGKTFILPSGKVWNLEKRSFTHENESVYTQFIALDVTELYRTHVALAEENARLNRVQSDLRQLSANVVAITREEEILNTKMRIHDEMGRCLVEARKYLCENNREDIPEEVVRSWQRSISMLKYNNDSEEEDMLLEIRKTCESMNMRFVQQGELPQEGRTAYILTCAVRECVTNAVRYAEASELYAEFAESEGNATVTVTNNGKQPKGEIVEGGGLSTLRRRVERAGGTMTVQPLPEFKLTVTVPKETEGVLL